MGFTTLTSGLTIKVPTAGTRNYYETLLSDTWQKISEHDHTGSGKGIQITASALSNNSVTDTSLRLASDGYLRSRNNAGSSDLNIVKTDTSDEIVFDNTNVADATRTSLGLAIGSDVQAYSSHLGAIDGLSKTDGNIIVANGTTYVAESGATARTSLGLGIGDSPTFTDVTISNAAYASIEVNDTSSSTNSRFDIFADASYPGGEIAYSHTVTASNINYADSTGRFTFGVTGIYLILLTVRVYCASQNVSATFYIEKNGTTGLYEYPANISPTISASLSNIASITLPFMWSLTASDYLNFYIDSATASAIQTYPGTGIVIKRIA